MFVLTTSLKMCCLLARFTFPHASEQDLVVETDRTHRVKTQSPVKDVQMVSEENRERSS